MMHNCGDCGDPFNKPDRGKGAAGPKPIRCAKCRKAKRNQESADYRYRERQQFTFMREHIRLMGLADAAGRLAEWLAPVDLQATARRCSKEGLADFQLA
jgi:hypothetical protein